MSEHLLGNSSEQQRGIEIEHSYRAWRHDRKNFPAGGQYTMNVDFVEYRMTPDGLRPVALIEITNARGSGALPHIDKRVHEQGIEAMYLHMADKLGVGAFMVAHTPDLTGFWVRKFGRDRWSRRVNRDEYVQWLQRLGAARRSA